MSQMKEEKDCIARGKESIKSPFIFEWNKKIVQSLRFRGQSLSHQRKNLYLGLCRN